VELEAQFEGEKAPKDFIASISFDGGKMLEVQFKNARALVKVPNFRLWSHNTPNLHEVTVKVPSAGDAVTSRFGVRQIGTADGRITLNGKPVYLKGVNRHESHYEFGATTPVQLMYEDIRNLKDMGGNFIRGSHYAQCKAFLDLCDEMGVLVWEESLGWGNRPVQLADPEFCDLQEEQTRMMVRNSINHPCVIISSFLNEPLSSDESCKILVDRLIKTIRAEDSGHLVTFACSHVEKDISNENTDIIAYNIYPCWYSHELETGSAEEMRTNIRKCHKEIVERFREFYKDERPVIVSESGVKADYGVRDPRGKSQYSEDFQEEYTRIMIEEIFGNRNIAGLAIWQFTDAKTYTRTRGLRNRSYGVNTGGLYDLYRRPKMVVDSVRKLFMGKDESQ
jgi:beta-glucuronidase